MNGQIATSHIKTTTGNDQTQHACSLFNWDQGIGRTDEMFNRTFRPEAKSWAASSKMASAGRSWEIVTSGSRGLDLQLQGEDMRACLTYRPDCYCCSRVFSGSLPLFRDTCTYAHGSARPYPSCARHHPIHLIRPVTR